MTVVSEAAAIGHQPSPRTVPTSMGADTKGLCQLFQRIWIWLEVACLDDDIWLLSWHGFRLPSLFNHWMKFDFELTINKLTAFNSQCLRPTGTAPPAKERPQQPLLKKAICSKSWGWTVTLTNSVIISCNCNIVLDLRLQDWGPWLMLTWQMQYTCWNNGAVTLTLTNNWPVNL